MYHGADSTDGGRGTRVWNHFWMKALGFAFLPVAAGLATRVAAPLVIKASDSDVKKAETLRTLSGVLHALGAAGAYYASGTYFEDSPSTQAFIRGGMWSEVMTTAAFAGGLNSSTPSAPVAAAVSGLGQSYHDQLLSLLTGGISNELARPSIGNRQLSR